MDNPLEPARSLKEIKEPMIVRGENRIGLAVILFQFFCSNMIVNYAFAFYPLFIDDYYPDISSFETGIFLSIPDFAILLFGIPIGELAIKLGRKTAIRVATITLLSSATALAFLTLVQNDQDVFLFASAFFRFIFGLGYIGVFVVGFGAIASDYGPNAGKYNGYGEGFGGLGLFAGPILGSIFYQYLDFFDGYAFLCGVYALCLIFVIFFYPKVRRDSQDHSDADEQIISYREILTTRVAFIYLFMLYFIQMTSGYILPIFTLNLSTSFKLTESHIALIFTAGQLVCAITAVLASKISTVPRRRWLSAFGCLIVTVSIFLMGPSRLLDLPNSYTLILIAMLLNGTGFTLVFIHVTPEVIRSVCEKKGIQVGSNAHLNERASTLFEFVFSLGQCMGPPIGGAIADSIGYRNAMDIAAIFSLICGVFACFGLFIKK